MMKSRPSLRSSARAGLNLFLVALLAAGCSYSVSPTFQHEDIAASVVSICKKEYNLDVKTKIVGQTFWLYLPLEDILEPPKKPEKYLEWFEIAQNNAILEEGTLKLDYSVKAIPEKEKLEEVAYKKSVADAKDKALRTLLRVLLSSKHQKETSPIFFYMVTADIKYGIAIKDLFYYHDLKKISYSLMSMTEFQHRSIQDTELSAGIIGDKEGNSLEYKNITLGEFIAKQVAHRVKLKFQKPEVEKKADIDKEVLKAVRNTVKAYDFRDFSLVELNNALTQNRIILNQAAVLNGPAEKKP